MIDQKKLMQIIDKFDSSRLTELNLESEDFKLFLKSEVMVQNTVSNTGSQIAEQPLSGDGKSAPAPENNDVTDPNKTSATETGLEIIPSPIVGTFYRSPAPDAPVFVDIGSKVSAGASLCIIEAMKIMNKLEADFDCEIVNILVESGNMVEYGTPLFEVKRL